MLTVIRLAAAPDAVCLPAIERSAAQSFRAIESLSWLADAEVMSVERHLQLIAWGTCWVAVDAAGQVQGFLSAQMLDDDLHIHELSVAQVMQGRGAGRQLLEAMMNEASLRLLRAVTLTTFRDVPWNAPFYQRLGFQPERSLAPDHRLAEALREEYRHGFAPGSRCAMSWQVPS